MRNKHGTDESTKGGFWVEMEMLLVYEAISYRIKGSLHKNLIRNQKCSVH